MDAMEIFREGQFHLMRGELEESVAAFTKAIDAGAPATVAHLSRGAAYMKMQKPFEAFEDFTAAIESDPDNARAYYYRGAALMLKGDYEAATADLTKTIELNPEHGAAFFARGACHAQLENDEQAAKDMKTALAFAETAAQGLADTFGIIRTHFDMAMAVLSGERRPSTVELTEKEQKLIEKWLKEDGNE